jgi:hypothetical protein
MSKYIEYLIYNPFKTWWKARKYFKRPKISFHFFWKLSQNCPIAYTKNVGKILDIYIDDVLWKDKYNSPRHERDPFIWVCFFKQFGFSINFDIYYRNEFGERVVGNMYYWEYMLDYLYYHHTLTCFPVWEGNSKLYKYIFEFKNTEGGSKDVLSPCKYIVPSVAMSLNKEGIKQLKKELKNA